MKNVNIERRKLGSIEQRAMVDGVEFPDKFGGVAAVVDIVTDMGWYEEKIARGAFDLALAVSDLDIRVLYNHEECQVLGRTLSGTGRVFVDDNGNLAYDYDFDANSPLHKTVASAIIRKDITQSSFAFTIEEVAWSYSEKHGEMGLRTITKIKTLYDVSPVTFPAYEDTEADSRSASLIEERGKFVTPEINVTELQQQEMRNSIDLCKLIQLKK